MVNEGHKRALHSVLYLYGHILVSIVLCYITASNICRQFVSRDDKHETLLRNLLLFAAWSKMKGETVAPGIVQRCHSLTTGRFKAYKQSITKRRAPKKFIYLQAHLSDCMGNISNINIYTIVRPSTMGCMLMDTTSRVNRDFQLRCFSEKLVVIVLQFG